MKATIGDEKKQSRIEYLKIAANYALPIFWAQSGLVKNNGTAFILDTGERVFGVTAAHVFNAYINDWKLGIVETCNLGDLNLPLQERLISIGTTDYVDIATFELTDAEIKIYRSRVLSGDQSIWPPTIPNEGESVVIAGYPGLERIQVKEFVCNFGAACFNIPISSISEFQFGCLFERKYWEDEFGKGLPQVNYNLGGISGAPVIALILRNSGIATWRLAGVAYQASASELLGEILFVNHARLIDSKGQVGKDT